MKLFKRSTQPSNCPTCQAGIDAEQISCVECGALLARRSTLAGVAWRLPVATVGAVALVMATGIGYASGAVVQDGDVSVAEAPAPGAQPGLPEASGSDGDGGGGGSDDLAQLDPPTAVTAVVVAPASTVVTGTVAAATTTAGMAPAMAMAAPATVRAMAAMGTAATAATQAAATRSPRDRSPPAPSGTATSPSFPAGTPDIRSR